MVSTISGARARGRPALRRMALHFVPPVAGILCGHGGQILRDHALGLAQFDHASMIEPHGAVADGLHVGGGVGNEENGDAARAQLMHLAHAALAEVDVAHGQGFIHQQNFGIDVDGHGESQAHHHAAGIGFHRLV